MECYFRQSWIDKRLAFNDSQKPLALSISMLARIWKPDTYFHNGKQSYLHTLTAPNKFVRIEPDGRVLYSSRFVLSKMKTITKQITLSLEHTAYFLHFEYYSIDE